MTNLETWRYNFIPEEGARELLQGERYGFAIDATTYGSPAYVGGPVGGTLAIHADNVTDKPNIPMDAAAGLLKGASPLVQSGTSPKMVHFPTSPYVRWSPHNLSPYSQTLDNAGITTDNSTVTGNTTTAPDGTLTAGTLTADSTGFDRDVRSTFITSVSGYEYTISCYVKAGTETWCNMTIFDNVGFDDAVGCYFELSGAGTKGTHSTTGPSSWPTTAATITSVGDGWYRCTLTTTVNVTAIEARVTIAETDNDVGVTAGDTIKVWGLQMNRGPIATPYLATTSAARIGIPQSYDTAAAQYGILVEPAVTNHAKYSEKFDTGSFWALSGVTASADTTTAPDGTTTADTLVEDSANSRHGIVTLISGSVTGRGTVSCYVKQKDRQWAHLASFSTDDNHTYGVTVDLTDGSVTSTQSANAPTNTSYSVTSIGNGWWRIAVTQDLVNGCYYLLGLSNSATPSYSGSLPSYTGDGASGMYVWGAQLEAGTVATSYIPTLGSTVTRATDNLTVAVPSFPFTNPCSEVIYANTLISANMWLIQIDPGSESTNRFLLYDDTATFTLYSGVTISTTPDHTIGTPFKGAARFKSGDFAAVLNGGTVGTDAGTNAVTGSTTLRIGIGASANNNLNGFVYQFTYFSRELSNAELQAKTT